MVCHFYLFLYDVTVHLFDIRILMCLLRELILSHLLCVIVFFYYNFFQAKFIAQIVVLGGQIIGKAFAQALKQEFQSK